MKLKFKSQQFQTDAVNAVVGLFEGQEKRTATFSVIKEAQMQFWEKDFGFANELLINDEKMLNNMHAVQKRQLLPLTDCIEDKSFCIEMETGTGKTYVYTKTIFELNKRYGFTKFIVVVPSVAIREGVYKSFEVTKDHFSTQYDNVPFRYFIYDSKKLSDVRQFAISSDIEIMIINIDAFKKAENIINQVQDRLNGESAMRYIHDTNPIVIIDEPQSVDNTPKAKEAIASLNPLCTLRYSATHKEKINLLYRLTPVDAYQMGLVKQICVSSNQVEEDFNKPYIRLVSVTQENGFNAKIEMDVKEKSGKIARKIVSAKPNSDLFLLSGEREIYDGYALAGIDCTPGYECIEFSNTETLSLGKSIGDIDENIIKRTQIKRTIETHLEKELRYLDKGIKVLSLFFIDEVKKYRTENGDKGLYAKMFEECYNELISLPKFKQLKNRFTADISKIHDGYFSQDKKGNYKNTKGNTIDDYNTYNTIMKDKEWLLSFDCPLRFIFSHSALKEGWDNPNVFQVCTLIEQKSTFTCRQKVGRGLRLCVNQKGERIEDRNINILHVMANESFAEFADKLQKEIEDETGMKFGVLKISMFSGVKYEEQKKVQRTISKSEAKIIVDSLKSSGYVSECGKPTEAMKIAISEDNVSFPENIAVPKESIIEVLKSKDTIDEEMIEDISFAETVTQEKCMSYEDAEELMDHFRKKGYIAQNGKIKDTMKNALINNNLDLPEKFEGARTRFERIISKADRKPPITDASKDVIVKLNKQRIFSPEFMELWNKIKQKTTYRVQIYDKELIEKSVKEFKSMPKIPCIRLVSKIADINIQDSGVTHTEREYLSNDIDDGVETLPDMLDVVSDATLIKRDTIFEIISKSERYDEFLNNPQLFTEDLIEIVKNNRYNLSIDGISYMKLNGEEYYVQEIFDSKELLANLEKNAVAVENSVYDYIIYDSKTVEKPFAIALDNDPDVKMFFKIPENFKIETPIGTYNPDWAVYIEREGIQKMYFVLETKGSTNTLDLRGKEKLKILCGKQHFKALNNGTDFEVATSWRDLKLRA